MRQNSVTPAPIDAPDEFLVMPSEEAARLTKWILATFTPSMREYRRADSYGFKHRVEESNGGFYVTNGQFKGAMLAAGFEPVNKDVQNWTFKISITQRCAAQMQQRRNETEPRPCLREPNLLSGLCNFHDNRKRSGFSVVLLCSAKAEDGILRDTTEGTAR